MQLAAIAAQDRYALAQRSYDSFAAAYNTVAKLPAAPAPDAVGVAIGQVNEGVALLGQAYVAIPSGAYNPGNEELVGHWAAHAVSELRSGSPTRALQLLDEILERVSNDFDLG